MIQYLALSMATALLLLGLVPGVELNGGLIHEYAIKLLQGIEAFICIIVFTSRFQGSNNARLWTSTCLSKTAANTVVAGVSKASLGTEHLQTNP